MFIQKKKIRTMDATELYFAHFIYNICWNLISNSSEFKSCTDSRIQAISLQSWILITCCIYDPGPVNELPSQPADELGMEILCGPAGNCPHPGGTLAVDGLQCADLRLVSSIGRVTEGVGPPPSAELPLDWVHRLLQEEPAVVGRPYPCRK